MLFNENIYLTIGAPESGSQNIRELAQSDVSILGKILKISKKNLLKSDQENLEFSIYSTGHRNPQGIVEINNKIFSTEHGPQGGDELNLIVEGGNYGWPLASYGERYGEQAYFKENFYEKNHKKNNYIEPIYAFVPSIAISQIITIENKFSPKWKDNFLITSLRDRSIYRVFLILIIPKSYRWKKYISERELEMLPIIQHTIFLFLH